MRRVALIGGAGFVGSHLALRLEEDGHQVLIVDALLVNNLHAEGVSDFHRKILEARRQRLKTFDFWQADARDYDVLSAILKSFRPETVVHLAAVAHQDRAQRSPHTTWGHSLRTLENALDISAHLGVKRFVYFSSSTVYGAWPETGIVSEETPCNPVHVYGSLKLAGEYATRSICHANGIESVVIRPSALYGPGCISGRVIQRFIENAIDGKPLEIRLNDWLDFTHVSDLVSGVALAIERPNAAGRIYNLTRGVARSVKEAAEIVHQHMPVGLRLLNSPGEFPPRGALDTLRARNELGYSPSVDLERGIEEYVAWYRTLTLAE